MINVKNPVGLAREEAIGDTMPCSIAVVSFLPDSGHVIPLLQIALTFANYGYPVVCYLPYECEAYLRGYNFTFRFIGSAFNAATRDAYSAALVKLSTRSIFYNAFSNYFDLAEGFWSPLRRRAADQLDAVVCHLNEQQPLFVLCDEHVFKALYVSLCERLRIPLVLHTTEGFRNCQSRFVKTYGISNLPEHFQSLVGALGATAEVFFRWWARVARFRTNSTVGDASGAEDWAVSNREAICGNDGEGGRSGLIYISTGLGYLEERYLGKNLTLCGNMKTFPPLGLPRTLALAADIREWLEADERPVIYVSFGSMVRVDSRLVRGIVLGSMLCNVRLLWSIKKSELEQIRESFEVSSSVKVVDFVPPLEVLKHPRVRCGINHGGSGSIQDCLLSGKPMLCIPFAWDQPFNGSLIEHLGVGMRMWRRRVSVGTIARSIEKLVSAAPFGLRARELACELRPFGDGKALVDSILSEPPVQRRAMYLKRCISSDENHLEWTGADRHFVHHDRH